MHIYADIPNSGCIVHMILLFVPDEWYNVIVTAAMPGSEIWQYLSMATNPHAKYHTGLPARWALLLLWLPPANYWKIIFIKKMNAHVLLQRYDIMYVTLSCFVYSAGNKVTTTTSCEWYITITETKQPLSLNADREFENKIIKKASIWKLVDQTSHYRYNQVIVCFALRS